MDYSEAAGMLLNRNTLLTVLLFLIAIAVLLVLAAQVVKACKELFGRKKSGNTFEQHCKDADDRFKAGERHIAENHAHIEDLQEGNRVICLSLLALLGHANRTSNGEEIEKAQNELTTYLINRK